MGDVETDKNDRPVDAPPKILAIEVYFTCFHFIFAMSDCNIKPFTKYPCGYVKPLKAYIITHE